MVVGRDTRETGSFLLDGDIKWFDRDDRGERDELDAWTRERL